MGTKREGRLCGWWNGRAGGGRCTYHPSFGRHVSVSRLVNVENRLTDPLLPLRPPPSPFATSVCPGLSSLVPTFTAPPLWSWKLFGRDRRLLISWPRLSSSGLVLTRRHSTRRIHWIRIAGDAPNTSLEFMRRDPRIRPTLHFIHKLTCCETMNKNCPEDNSSGL